MTERGTAGKPDDGHRHDVCDLPGALPQAHAEGDPGSPSALRAVGELLAAQCRRVRAFTERQEESAAALGEAAYPHSEPETARAPPLPGRRALLEAVPAAAILVRPLFGERGQILDYRLAEYNAAAHAYVTESLPPGAPLPGLPLHLLRDFPNLAETPVPGMLAATLRTGREQGPEAIEWYLSAPGGPVRLSHEVRTSACAGHALVTWDRGHRRRMARQAQRLARTAWAEWGLADETVEASRGLARVLGRPAEEPPPTLFGLARMADPETLSGLYDVLRAVLLHGETADCVLSLSAPEPRVIRLVAEPVRLPRGPVWTVRAVLRDVTEMDRSRQLAAHAEQEARREHERYEAVAEVAERLREAVLPRFPAEPERYGLDSAAVYRPDGGVAGVGGDWYKMRMLPDARVLIALGDARGHGLDAVALMAKLRYALAGLAYTGAGVERLAQWLNDLACHDGSESTTTAIIGHYSPRDSTLRWTCAGHPRPVLVREGAARLLEGAPDGPGLPLGVLAGAAYDCVKTQLRHGDLLLLYSDGLIERRGRDIEEGIGALLDSAARAAREVPVADGAGLQRYADAVVQSLTGPGQWDDATLLAFRVMGREPG